MRCTNCIAQFRPASIRSKFSKSMNIKLLFLYENVKDEQKQMDWSTFFFNDKFYFSTDFSYLHDEIGYRGCPMPEWWRCQTTSLYLYTKRLTMTNCRDMWPERTTNICTHNNLDRFDKVVRSSVFYWWFFCVKKTALVIFSGVFFCGWFRDEALGWKRNCFHLHSALLVCSKFGFLVIIIDEEVVSYYRLFL